MGLFDRFKKTEVQIDWKDANVVAGVPVDFVIKKEILSHRNSKGIIYIEYSNQTYKYEYSYGNLSDIISSNILNLITNEVFVCDSDEGMMWKLKCE